MTPVISEELSMQDSANWIIVAKGLSDQPHLSPSFGFALFFMYAPVEVSACSSASQSVRKDSHRSGTWLQLQEHTH